MKLPVKMPTVFASLNKEQFDLEIEKGMADVQAGRVVSADEAESQMRQKYGI